MYLAPYYFWLAGCSVYVLLLRRTCRRLVGGSWLRALRVATASHVHVASASSSSSISSSSSSSSAARTSSCRQQPLCVLLVVVRVASSSTLVAPWCYTLHGRYTHEATAT